jgi:predicted ribonuclease YlaK
MQNVSMLLKIMIFTFLLKVFEEIDKHKKRQDAVGAQARKIIRIWDELRSRQGSLDKGVRAYAKDWALLSPLVLPELPKDLPVRP